MDRRTFLKITGVGSVAFAAGCNADPEKKLHTLVRSSDDMVTGRATWYASTCRECPAGCGVLAKNREGRVVKLEGNPLHPVNQGKLCMRGQAALQALYNPDRLTGPLVKTDGNWQPIDSAQAQALIGRRMAQAAASGPGRIGMLTEVVGHDLLDLFTRVLEQHQANAPLIFEPLAFESLKFAHQQVFGRPVLPGLRMDQADMLLSFGADFLETWLSPVEYARKFKAMHTINHGQKGLFVQVSPYQSLTAANADRWLACRPGSEAAIVLMLIQHALQSGRGHRLPTPFRASLNRLTQGYSSAKVADRAGLPAEELDNIADRLLSARQPLVLGANTACHGPAAVALDLAATLLNTILDPQFALFDFDQRHRVEVAHSREAIEDYWTRVAEEPPDLLLLHNVNPLYGLPAQSRAAKVLNDERTFVVSFTNFMDATAAAADLIFPPQLALETWDIYDSKQSMASVLQPTMGKITAADGIGDLFVAMLPDEEFQGLDYRQYLMRRLERRDLIGSRREWLEMLQRGGRFAAGKGASRPEVRLDERPVALLAEIVESLSAEPSDKTTLYLMPSSRHYDGRGANRPWLSEIPDPISQVAWQTVAWVPRQVMQAKGWSDGEVLGFKSPHGYVEAQAYAHGGLQADAVVIAMGQGHDNYGRYAQSQGINPVALMGAGTVARAGAPVYATLIDKITAPGETRPLATTAGSRFQYGRKIALSVALEKASHADDGQGLTMHDFPFTLPLPEGYDPHRDIYPAHEHADYRWGMVVDLDRCVGCGACVASCYAENNVGLAGEEQVVKGREMAWLRIERYENPDDPTRLIFLPMLCQHCDNAPCEPVCPVYAPHHSPEGLNNQVYNRCIGTRFCAQNCPYKVRRFNWLKWQWPEPLNMQLNPDVTVRTAGVMEKCSFCVQRIKAAHGRAKDEKRAIRDGEVVPACVQTCPTTALYFGNLIDPQSTVRKLIDDPRAYQVLGYLNTKPAVIYLKKVTQTL